MWRQDIVDAITGATPHLSDLAFVHRDGHVAVGTEGGELAVLGLPGPRP